MKKIKLIALGNYEKYNHYSIKKDKSFFKIFGALFDKVLKTSTEFDEEWDSKKEVFTKKKRKIKKYKDIHESFRGEGDTRLDIFYGEKLIFITLYCKDKIREKFNEELFKVTYMVKPKKSWKKTKKKSK